MTEYQRACGQMQTPSQLPPNECVVPYEFVRVVYSCTARAVQQQLLLYPLLQWRQGRIGRRRAGTNVHVLLQALYGFNYV